MSKPLDKHDGTDKVFAMPGRGKIMCSGPTVPADGAKGYAKWCWFHHSDGATLDTAWYINKGDIDSADFDALDLTSP